MQTACHLACAVDPPPAVSCAHAPAPLRRPRGDPDRSPACLLAPSHCQLPTRTHMCTCTNPRDLPLRCQPAAGCCALGGYRGGSSGVSVWEETVKHPLHYPTDAVRQQRPRLPLPLQRPVRRGRAVGRGQLLIDAAYRHRSGNPVRAMSVIAIPRSQPGRWVHAWDRVWQSLPCMR